jgi:hypothetical protein
MLTKDDLEQIQKLPKANNGAIRQEIQLAKTEVINVVRKAEDEIIETLRDTTGVLATKQDALEKRLEDHVSISHPQ